MTSNFRQICLETARQEIAPGRCLMIGEVAQTHDGSLGQAHAFIDAIANAGADAVKFQTHIAHAESTPDEPWRVNFSRKNESRFEYWKRMEFEPEEWSGLKEHAKSAAYYSSVRHSRSRPSGFFAISVSGYGRSHRARSTTMCCSARS